MTTKTVLLHPQGLRPRVRAPTPPPATPLEWSYRYYYKKSSENFALQTTTTFVKKGSMIFFCRVVLNQLILRKY